MKIAEIVETARKYDNGIILRAIRSATRKAYLDTKVTMPFVHDDELKEVLKSTAVTAVIGELCTTAETNDVMVKFLGEEFIKEFCDEIKIDECMEVI